MEEKEQQLRFDRLIERHHRLVEALCRRHTLGDAAQCADLVQECYVTLWRRLRSLRPAASATQETRWVVWQCRSVLTHSRRRRRLATVPIDDQLADTLAAVDDDSLREQLDEMASALNERERLALALMLEGYTLEECASRLNSSPESMAVMRHRIVAKMRQARIEAEQGNNPKHIQP